jgi:glutathione synthase/RimK-type ligase-like ATP-grasp enzyme
LIIAIATCSKLPEPDSDETLLLDALRKRGADPRMVPWDNPGAGLDGARACVIRSTWNYYHHHAQFLGWAERAERKVPLFNDAATVRWNSHKGYLVELAARGAPVVPTEICKAGSAPQLNEILARRGWNDVVVKPAVSAGSFETRGMSGDSVAEHAGWFAAMVAVRDMMVQPYVRSVDGHGERCLVFLDGELSHAIRKNPRFADGHESVSGPMPVADDERAAAESILKLVDAPLLYARVDLARDDRGAPQLMELEVIEPSLFLMQHPPALARFADAIIRWSANPPRSR